MSEHAQDYELKLADGRVVRWHGTDGAGAAFAYVRAHPEAEVVAWRLPAMWVGSVHPSAMRDE